MARPKKPATTGDLVRSILVILVPLVIISYLFTRLPDDHPVKTVDWVPVLASARAQSPYPVLAPANLPADWRATRVIWVKTGTPYLNGQPSVRNLWQLGFLDPKDTYIAVEQGDLQPDDFVADTTRAGTPDGQSVLAGTTWERRISPDGRTRSLVARDAKVVSVVSGDVSYDQLDAFAGTLRSS